MNQWIERNIIFPKVNDEVLKLEKAEKQKTITNHIISELKRRKFHSMYRIGDYENEEKRGSTTSIKNIKELVIKQKQISKYCKEIENMKKKESTKHREDYNQTPKSRQKLFFFPREDNHTPGYIRTNAKTRQQKQQQHQALMHLIESKFLSNKKSKIKYKSMKIKTEAVEEMLIKKEPIRYYSKDIIVNAKKAIKLDYSSHRKFEKSPKVQSMVLPKLDEKCNKIKQKHFEITQIKGWKFYNEEVSQLL